MESYMSIGKQEVLEQVSGVTPYGGGLAVFLNNFAEYHDEIQLIVNIVVGICVVATTIYNIRKK